MPKKKMNELDELRAGRIQEIQQQQQIQEQVQQLEMFVKQHMTKEALQRYGTFKTAHPQKAVELLAYIGQLLQAGQVKSIDDFKLKQLLIKLMPQKREFRLRQK